MKCLSVKQPWASLIFGVEPTEQNSFCQHYRDALPKDIENRTWPTPHRGPLLIHASRTPDTDWLEEFFGSKKAEHCNLPTGCILGQVELVGCHEYRYDPAECCASVWANEDCWHWVLANPVEFAEPMPWKGSLGLWDVPDRVALELMLEVRAA